MRFLHAWRQGVRQARSRPRLVLLLYMVPLLPALGLAMLVLATVAPVWGRSLFAQKVLTGSWFGVWRHFTAIPENHLPVVLGPGLLLALVGTVVAQVVLSAGIFAALFGDRAAQGGDVCGGMRHFAFPFFRSFLWFFLGLGLAAAACGAVVRGFFKLAENQADARWDLAGVLVAGVLFFLLYVPLRGAYDLSRMATVRHGDRKTLRGFFKALLAVLRHPVLFFPLYASFLMAILVVHALFGWARLGFTGSHWSGMAALVLAQQTVMLVRGFLHLGCWGAAMEAYRMLGEVRYCRGTDKPLEAPPPAVPLEDVFR